MKTRRDSNLLLGDVWGSTSPPADRRRGLFRRRDGTLRKATDPSAVDLFLTVKRIDDGRVASMN